jgi:hypothetical protein
MAAQGTPRTRSIYDAEFKKELDQYTHTILARIAARLELPMVDVLSAYHDPSHTSKNSGGMLLSDDVELEYITCNGDAYLYDTLTNKVYTYANEPQFVGNLSDEGMIV